MPKYNVDWSKTYVVTGTVELEAESISEAETYALWDIIGDLEGSMQYVPDQDTGHARLAIDELEN